MKGKIFPLAALLLAQAVAAAAQAPTPTPAPTTVASGILHPTDGTARVNGVRIRVQPDGSVWFLEATSDSIVVFKDGVMKRWQIRANTKASPLGANPVDFEIDGDVIWFIESGESNIPPGTCAYAKLDTSTNQLTEWVVPGGIPAAFHRNPDGTVWLPQSGAVMQLLNLDNADNPPMCNSVPLVPLHVCNYRSALTYAYADMVVGPDGAFWMADFGDNRIVRWVPGADTETSWTFYPLSSGRLNPAQIAFDQDGFLWIAQFTAGRVDRFDPSTGEIRSYSGIASPVHFEITQGRLYVTSGVSTSTVSVLDPRIAVPVGSQILTAQTLDVHSSPSTREAYLLNPTPPTIEPTLYTSVPAPIAADQIKVSNPAGTSPGVLTTTFPSTHAYGVTVADGIVWVGTDGQLAELNLQTIGGATDWSVPVATSRAGSANSKVRIDLTVTNRGTAAIAEDALYLFSSGSFAARATFSIAPGETQFVEDAFGNVATAVVDGPIRLATTTGDPAGLVVTARSARVLPNGGTYGYTYPAAPASASLVSGFTTTLFTGALDTEVSILGLYALDAATATLTLLAPDGTSRGARDVKLVKNTFLEFNPAASAFGASAEPGDVVRVAVTAGSLQAYVNVYDAGSADIAPSSPITAAADAVIPNAGSLVVSADKSYVSDLFLSNPDSGQSAEVSVAFYPIGVEGPPQVASLTLAPLQSQAIQNFLPTLFGVVSGQGALLVTSSIPIAAATRIAARYPSTGDYGTYASAIGGTGIEGGSSASFFGCPQTSTRRTNLLLYNRGSAGEVTVTGFKSDGSQAGQLTVPVGDHAAGRLDSVFAAFGITDQPAGSIRLDVPAGMNVYAWTAAVDGVTGDVDISPPQ